MTFLLIEDDRNDVLFVQQEFKGSGNRYRLEVVSDGIEAVRYLEGTHGYEDRGKFPLPAVIMLDLKMPRFSGFDFLHWLRMNSPNQLDLIPVVVFSASHLPEDAMRAYALGVNAYMVKPGHWREFRERLRVLLAYWGEHVETPELFLPVSSVRATRPVAGPLCRAS
jgi:CheY-like chemotaxis protein